MERKSRDERKNGAMNERSAWNLLGNKLEINQLLPTIPVRFSCFLFGFHRNESVSGRIFVVFSGRRKASESSEGNEKFHHSIVAK